MKELESVVPTRVACNLLHIHPNTLRRWSDAGIIRAYRIGSKKHRRFILTDINNFLHGVRQ
jgi:excisionase family DNA binding protein